MILEEALASVRFDAVIALQRDQDFSGNPMPFIYEHGNSIDEWPELKPQTLGRTAAEVKRARAKALFRRRHRLRSDLMVELRKRGIQTEYSAAGPLFAKFGDDEHLLLAHHRARRGREFPDDSSSPSPASWRFGEVLRHRNRSASGAGIGSVVAPEMA
jgi:hypothetical protein